MLHNISISYYIEIKDIDLLKSENVGPIQSTWFVYVNE